MISASALYSALCNPRSHFRLLSNLQFNGKAQDIVQQGAFLETQISIEHKRYMLYLPCAELSREQELLFSAINSPLFEPYTILRDELILDHSHCNTTRFDVIIQPIPKAVPLSDAPLDATIRQALIESFEQECCRFNLTNRTLTERDILVDSANCLHIIRYHNITASETMPPFCSLRSHFESLSSLNDIEEQYLTSTEHNLHHCDNYQLYHKQGRSGYIGTDGHSVITAKYLKVGDFYEGRAIVQTDNGFGVIDTQGRLIIEDSFQSIKYTTNHSRFIAYFEDGKYVTFDHNGTRIPNDTISPTPKW